VWSGHLEDPGDDGRVTVWIWWKKLLQWETDGAGLGLRAIVGKGESALETSGLGLKVITLLTGCNSEVGGGGGRIHLCFVVNAVFKYW
jgi:hypothetical protein